MSLASLPSEIAYIISELLSTKDVLATITTSRSLYKLFLRPLYRLAREHKTCRSNELAKGLRDVTFWFDQSGSGSAIEWAINNNKLSTFLRLLVEPGMNLLQTDNYGVMLMHRLSGQGLVQYLKPLAKRLEDLHIDPFQVDISLLTPLHYAAGRGMTEAVILLLALGADSSAKDHHGNTPLHLAAVNGLHQVFKYLVQAGAEVASEGRFGWAPIDQASISQHHVAVAELRRLGSRSPRWQHKKNALNEFIRLSPCPQECYLYHAVF